MNAVIALILAAQLAWSHPANGPTCKRSRSEVVPIFKELLNTSLTAARETERAMFLTRDSAGNLTGVLWPATMQLRKATFRGRMPSATVAIAHTHPPGMPKPSQHDVDEAARTGLPIYVVTRTSIYRVDPDRRITEVLWSPDWQREIDRFGDAACA